MVDGECVREAAGWRGGADEDVGSCNVDDGGCGTDDGASEEGASGVMPASPQVLVVGPTGCDGECGDGGDVDEAAAAAGTVTRRVGRPFEPATPVEPVVPVAHCSLSWVGPRISATPACLNDAGSLA